VKLPFSDNAHSRSLSFSQPATAVARARRPRPQHLHHRRRLGDWIDHHPFSDTFPAAAREPPALVLPVFLKRRDSSRLHSPLRYHVFAGRTSAFPCLPNSCDTCHPELRSISIRYTAPAAILCPETRPSITSDPRAPRPNDANMFTAQKMIRRKKNVKKGIQFCLMVCGASGTGESLSISLAPTRPALIAFCFHRPDHLRQHSLRQARPLAQGRR